MLTNVVMEVMMMIVMMAMMLMMKVMMLVMMVLMPPQPAFLVEVVSLESPSEPLVTMLML